MNREEPRGPGSESEVQKLLRMKGLVPPPEGYVENFLSEFHERQRSELLRRSARGLFVERIGTWLWHPSGRGLKLAAAGVGGVIMLGAVVQLNRRSSTLRESSGALPPSTEAGLFESFPPMLRQNNATDPEKNAQHPDKKDVPMPK